VFEAYYEKKIKLLSWIACILRDVEERVINANSGQGSKHPRLDKD